MFLRALGAGGGAGLLAAAPGVAAQEPEAPAVDPSKAEAEARMALIVARFGAHLGDAEREEVRRQVDGVVRQGRELREFALENGDAPSPIFRPFRAPLA